MKMFDSLSYVIQGNSYKVNQYITIYNPTVDEVINFGEDYYDTLVNLLTRRPYDIAVELWDRKIDYSTLTNWDLFFETAPNIPIEYSCILFGRYDFTKLKPYENVETGMKILADPDDLDNKIDEAIYQQIVDYVRHVHFISDKLEYDMGNETGRRFLIKRMRRKREKLLKDYASGKIRPESRIFNMIMFCVNNPGFKYDYTSVRNLTLPLLYETFHFLIHDNGRNLMTMGIYAGRVDPTQMKDKSSLEIMPDLHK